MFDFQSEPAIATSPQASLPAAPPSDAWNPLRAFFGVVLEPRVYARMLYVWLAFPLGLAYFVALVTLLPLGAGLLIIWVGIAVLAFAGLSPGPWCTWRECLATVLLGTPLGPARRFRPQGEGLWKLDQVGARLARLLEGPAVPRAQVSARARRLGHLGGSGQRLRQPHPRARGAWPWTGFSTSASSGSTPTPPPGCFRSSGCFSDS